MAVAVLVLAITVAVLKSSNKDENLKGGSTQGGSYNSTTTTQAMFTATRFQLLKTGQGVLGSAVITNATALAPFNLYDATTTVNGGIYGTTTLASFGATTVSGDFIFDSAFTKGLIIEFPSGASPASTTITWQ